MAVKHGSIPSHLQNKYHIILNIWIEILKYHKAPQVLGHPKILKFPFHLNLKLISFRCPEIWAHNSLIIICSNIETPKNINFPFGTNGKLMALGVPILQHFRVICADS